MKEWDPFAGDSSAFVERSTVIVAAGAVVMVVGFLSQIWTDERALDLRYVLSISLRTLGMCAIASFFPFIIRHLAADDRQASFGLGFFWWLCVVGVILRHSPNSISSPDISAVRPAQPSNACRPPA